jgi:transposase-like protein
MERKPQRPQAKKIARHFETLEAARDHLAQVRWPNGPICPKCGSAEGAYTLKDGRFRCKDKDCRTSFTVTTGTVFESSHIPLHKWLLAVYLLCSSRKGISSHQLHCMMGVTYKTAWFMTHRIREAMKAGSLLPPIGGPGKVVEMDETYIGRNPFRKKGPGYAHKLAVVSLVERKGPSRSFYIEHVNSRMIEKIVRENIHRESEVNTDSHNMYRYLDEIVARHEAIDHGAAEYARYEGGRVISTNSIEGFFSLFKRGMRGIYQHCKEKHLHRYLSEFDFRYGNRHIDDVQRTDEALKGIVGKRLTYRRTRQQPPA